MLEHYLFEDVHFWKVARSYLGKSLYTTGFFLAGDLLIDCGPPNASRQLQPVFKDLPFSQVLITHHHEDHTGNAALLHSLRGITPLAHASAAQSLLDVSRNIP